jgi:hypothetical protein
MFVPGDRLTARALADGTVEVYRNSDLVATFDTKTKHGTWFASRGGHFGVCFLQANKAAFDNFNGGTLT